MRFTVERNDLTDAVAWTARTVPSRNAVPALSGLLLEAADGTLTLSGYDFETAATASVAVSSSEGGRALVSGRLLSEICRSLPSAPVELSTEGTKLVITCGSSRFQLMTMPVEDYPTLPSSPATVGRLSGSTLAAAVAQVAIAANRDDTLPVLTGVRVEIEGERLTLVATDRYRLAVREVAWRPESADLSAVALIPAKFLADAAKSLAGAAEVEIALATGDSPGVEALAGFTAGERRTTTRLLDGTFPNYRTLLPSDHRSLAEVDVATLTDALKRVSLVLGSRASSNPVTCDFGTDGELRLSAGVGEEASATESIPCSLEGDAQTIAFNSGYFLDGLAQIEGDTARLTITEATRPAILTGKTSEGAPVADYRYLIMPMRLPG
jgi:DNA polymerase-3 subunit beta